MNLKRFRAGPERIVFDRVRVDGLVLAAVHGPIGLVVAAKIHTAQRDGVIDPMFQIAVRILRPCHSSSRAVPTLT